MPLLKLRDFGGDRQALKSARKTKRAAMRQARRAGYEPQVQQIRSMLMGRGRGPTPPQQTTEAPRAGAPPRTVPAPRAGGPPRSVPSPVPRDSGRGGGDPQPRPIARQPRFERRPRRRRRGDVEASTRQPIERQPVGQAIRPSVRVPIGQAQPEEAAGGFASRSEAMGLQQSIEQALAEERAARAAEAAEVPPSAGAIAAPAPQQMPGPVVQPTPHDPRFYPVSPGVPQPRPMPVFQPDPGQNRWLPQPPHMVPNPSPGAQVPMPDSMRGGYGYDDLTRGYLDYVYGREYANAGGGGPVMGHDARFMF